MESFKALIRRRDELNSNPENKGRFHITTEYFIRFSTGSLAVGFNRTHAKSKLIEMRNSGWKDIKLESEPILTDKWFLPDTTVEWALNQDPKAANVSAFVEKLEEVFNQ